MQKDAQVRLETALVAIKIFGLQQGNCLGNFNVKCQEIHNSKSERMGGMRKFGKKY
jgi:hypothetical protein